LPAKARLDNELVRRGLVRSRSEAASAIDEGKVMVRGLPVTRAAALVDAAAPITLSGTPRRFVSRGGEKLHAALEQLGVAVAGRRWLDAGASTGGFTDCLLQRGAVSVIALDVGYGQLHWELRKDHRVVVLERTNVRSLATGQLPWTPEGVTADLSFISLTLALPGLVAVADPGADFVLLVKPQFELERGSVGKGGVVRDPRAWRRALLRVTAAADDVALGVVGAAASPLPGPAGNREFFLHLRRGAPADPPSVIEDVLSEVER
jgi:23S rRNA (cytidine1920-2'-O)/16S rRNA (cytidine1409-2'-O)-methyltransferase